MKQKSILKNFNNSKGITLIALVVTIIILLILAGISITMITGNNGIISSTETSKQIYEIGQYRDIIQVARESARKKKLQDETVNYLNEISSILEQEKNIDKCSIENNSLKVETKEGYVFKVTDISVNLIKINDIKFVEESNETNGINVKVESEEKGIQYQYKIDDEEWKKYNKDSSIYVPFGSTIYARTYDREKHGIEIDLFVYNSDEWQLIIENKVVASGKTGEKKSVTISNNKTYKITYMESEDSENILATDSLDATLNLESLSLELETTNIPETYIYTFGNGNVIIDNLEYQVDSIKIPNCDIKKDEYSFGGWKSENTGDLYNSGDTYDEIDDNILYAQWNKKGEASYKIIYYSENAYDEEYETKEEVYSSVTEKEIVITPTEKIGFTLDNSLSKLNGIVEEDNSLVLEVYYKRKNYNLTIDPNGGTWESTTNKSEKSGKYGSTLGIPEPERTGYTFTGWSKGGEDLGTGEITYTYKEDNVTITANWEEITLNGTLTISGDSHILTSKTYSYSGVEGVSSVTWSTSDSTIATVNSSGNLTPVRSGKVILTLSVTGYDGSVKTAKKTIYIYALLKNKKNGSNLYIFKTSGYSTTGRRTYDTSTSYTLLGLRLESGRYQIWGGNAAFISCSDAINYFAFPTAKTSSSVYTKMKYSNVTYYKASSTYMTSTSPYHKFIRATSAAGYYTMVNGLKFD